MLTIFSFVLFGTLMLSDNNFVTNKLRTAIENEHSIAVLGLAQSSVPTPDTASATEFLSAKNFSGIDDYNNYKRIINTAGQQGDTVSVTLNYATLANPDQVVASRTYVKKMTVTSPFIL